MVYKLKINIPFGILKVKRDLRRHGRGLLLERSGRT